MNKSINELIKFGLDKNLITKDDVIYSVNLLLDLFGLDDFHEEEVKLRSNNEILDDMLEWAVSNNLIEDSITQKDLFDTRIMNCIMPRPSEVIKTFNDLYNKDSKEATDYFYNLSIASNYIRKSRTDKNIKFNHFYKYGDIQISINLSKPEKDPKEIAKAKTIKSSGYPKCLLCKENVGFAGSLNHPARQTHRIIPITLNNDQYYFQYSPYVYYNEHCIIFNDEHKPMVINEDTFKHLFSFIDKFPHYMLGSNADLPIVGGSILTHDHYQGGRHHFPIEDAKVIKTYKLNGYNCQVDMVEWPLSTIRLTGKSSEELIKLSTKILNKWIDYSDESLDIISHSNSTRHNTITPIARMKDGLYQIDLVLRNNRTNDKYPDGIFHPHKENHHIKKENIGLIEVMGLAVLPARLKDELKLLKDCLLDKDKLSNHECLEKHTDWFNYLKSLDINKDNIDEVIEIEVTKKFVSVLENAGVYKMDEKGKAGFNKFVESLND
ncbi:MAG: UDP-glucose--hexose-1-phosphate uridylyltransferase [Thomasclavelia sp.]|nr:UDP-glucose--hexose-1-phosphate uridylyltransferase [Thomasclavelia sp.]